MDNGRSLGLMIRGGAEYGLGIYITGVDPGSAAHAGELKVTFCLNKQATLTLCYFLPGLGQEKQKPAFLPVHNISFIMILHCVL
ncbi:hypothetical protein AMECASPLE_038326 [Ameca splendens]